MQQTRRTGIRTALAVVLLAVLFVPAGVHAADSVDEVHYTFTGETSVAFDWRGSATDIRYGPTAAYGQTATANAAYPSPISSAGPFQEVELEGLEPGTTYHYSIGGGTDYTFTTAPTGSFRFAVMADVGSSAQFSSIPVMQNLIAGQNPDFVLAPGDLTYGYPFGPTSVDRHFNDVMAWSTRAAYMPAWGNHEWESPSIDDLRNYKGRFALPHPQTASSAPAPGCCGEDWSWFDAGAVRFIAYPEPYSSSTFASWSQQADPIFQAAQNDQSIKFIVTFGHRPAYSTGFHEGDTNLAGVLNTFGDRYSKYVLNLNGHSHDYERFQPIHGVTHITTGGGGSPLETPWSGTDSRTAFRAFHLEYLRADVSDTGMRVDAICGPPTSQDDLGCVQGSVIDSVTFGTNPPPAPPPPPTLYVDKTDPNCSNNGAGTKTQPFCAIKPAAGRVVAGQTVQVGSGTYAEEVKPLSSGTEAAPINFAPAPGTHPVITGTKTGSISDGFYINGLSYITIQGFGIETTSGDGVIIKNSSNVTLRNVEVSQAGLPISGKTAKGIRVEASTDCVVANNKLHNNTNNGIYVLSGSTRNQIVGNDVYANAVQYDRIAAGIRFYGASGNTVAANIAHDNEDSGIEFFSNSTGNVVVNNRTYGNGDHGIDNNVSPGQRIVSNTVYDNDTAGINVEGGSTGTTIANNISVDNGVDSTRTKSNIRVDSASTAGTSMDYDLVYLSAPGTMLIWNSTSYSSLTAFVAATGKETHGIQADPRWEDPAAHDFDLMPGSQAIDSANSGVTGQTATDAHDEPRLDDPNTPNTGAGTRKYDDRGALEFPLEEVTDAPPNVVLFVSPTAGTAPLHVTADASDSTDGDATPIETYTFDFGDGTVKGPQSGATATHDYSTPGTFTVTVTVTDRAGLSSTATTDVRVNPPADLPPSAVLSVTPASGEAPLSVTADASGSSDSDASPIDTYTFDFGDGTIKGPQSGATANHVFAQTGTFTVTVTVRDTAGLTSTASTQVTVTNVPDAPPSAQLSVSPGSGSAPLEVTADASASSDTDSTPVDTYKFDFGDGTVVGPQSEPTATHSFTEPGTYTVTVTVTDTAGLWSRATREVAVDPADVPPTAALTVTPTSGTAPLDVTADASGSTDPDPDGISSYRFDFGDGTVKGPQAGPTANHQYTSAGTYTVTVTVADASGLTSTASTQVTVLAPDAPPSAVVVATPHSGTAPLDVTADASGSTDTDSTPIDHYRFDFGDGTVKGPQSGATATHTYTQAGTFTLTVTVTDTAGQSSAATTQVTVTAPNLPPSASLTATPSAGLVPLQVNLDASGSTDPDAFPIDTYRFDFGDGATTPTQTSAFASHTYTAAGVYTAKVTVTDKAGASSTATVQITAYANFVGNPGFESNLNGWNTSGSGSSSSLTKVSGGHSGGWAAKLSNPGPGASTIVLNDSPDWAKPTAAGTYTGSLWVRGDVAGASLKLRFREYSGNTLVGTATTTATLSTSWQVVTVSYRTASPGSTLDFNAYVTSAPAGTAVYADDASIYLAP
jgi:parallel beta-helix repeat protein